MSTQNDDGQGVVWTVLVGVVLLAISLAVGIGLYRTGQGAAGSAAVASTGVTSGGGGDAPAAAVQPATDASAAAGTDAATAAAAGSAPTATADGASVRIDDGVVKFYFASGSTELAAGAKEALADVVKGVAAGQKAVISGYHDTTGDPAKNEELAKLRAFAVRDALVSLGIGEDKLDLRKPEVTTADGSNAEARRVEVRLE
ncbi:OmpA family protein [Ottowia sp.]|uniref:OmpA family protein n=1 Tax=Ottowia sp. TaxID=1898956 RepID=UPI002BCFAB01|nr:OmpA family protein [Ottowia sp.]HRN75620.1 OmpA family protein [Ottowia sp.]HRQ01611.1 OmpA family protein [Ottowia sp.]